MKNSCNVILVILGFTLAACSSPEPKVNKGKLESRLSGLMDSLNSPDHKQVFLTLTDSFSQAFPFDSSTAVFVNQAAKICTRIGNYEKAVTYRSFIIHHFPDYPKKADLLFGIGFMYNNELDQKDSAEKYYNWLISEYPDHEMVESAQFELDHLGEDESTIIEQFKKKNNLD